MDACWTPVIQQTILNNARSPTHLVSIIKGVVRRMLYIDTRSFLCSKSWAIYSTCFDHDVRHVGFMMLLNNLAALSCRATVASAVACKHSTQSPPGLTPGEEPRCSSTLMINIPVPSQQEKMGNKSIAHKWTPVGLLLDACNTTKHSN